MAAASDAVILRMASADGRDAADASDRTMSKAPESALGHEPK